MLHHYGSRFADVLSPARDHPRLAATFGSSAIIKAQVIHAVRQEMAQNLADIVFRRTDLATGCYPGERVLRDIAALVAPMFWWDRARIEQEIEAVQARFPPRKVKAIDRRDDAAAPLSTDMSAA